MMENDLQLKADPRPCMTRLHVPDELWVYIFFYLSPNELCTSSRVCRHWYVLTKDPFIWRYHYSQAAFSPVLKVLSNERHRRDRESFVALLANVLPAHICPPSFSMNLLDSAGKLPSVSSVAAPPPILPRLVTENVGSGASQEEDDSKGTTGKQQSSEIWMVLLEELNDRWAFHLNWYGLYKIASWRQQQEERLWHGDMLSLNQWLSGDRPLYYECHACHRLLEKNLFQESCIQPTSEPPHPHHQSSLRNVYEDEGYSSYSYFDTMLRVNAQPNLPSTLLNIIPEWREQNNYIIDANVGRQGSSLIASKLQVKEKERERICQDCVNQRSNTARQQSVERIQRYMSTHAQYDSRLPTRLPRHHASALQRWMSSISSPRAHGPEPHALDSVENVHNIVQTFSMDDLEISQSHATKSSSPRSRYSFVVSPLNIDPAGETPVASTDRQRGGMSSVAVSSQRFASLLTNLSATTVSMHTSSIIQHTPATSSAATTVSLHHPPHACANASSLSSSSPNVSRNFHGARPLIVPMSSSGTDILGTLQRMFEG